MPATTRNECRARAWPHLVDVWIYAVVFGFIGVLYATATLSREQHSSNRKKASVFLSEAAKQVARVWRCRLSRWEHPRWTRHGAAMGGGGEEEEEEEEEEEGGCVLVKEHVLRIYSDVQHRRISLFSFGRRADERHLERAGAREMRARESETQCQWFASGIGASYRRVTRATSKQASLLREKDLNSFG
jgi:hypothetical protein